MSVDLMSWAFKQDIEPPAKLVLLALADHANGETGLCIPGQKSLAKQCSMSVRTIQRHLATLESAGLIRREARMRGEGRGRTSDRYWLRDQGDNTGPTRQSVTTKATNQDDQGDTVVVAEPEENRKGNNTLAAPPRQRKPDPLWDTMLAVCGIDGSTLTKTGRGQVNAALKELREIGATPADIEAKAKAYRKTWPDVSLTPTALVKHWGSLAVKAQQVSRTCECGQPYDRHADEIHDILIRGGL